MIHSYILQMMFHALIVKVETKDFTLSLQIFSFVPEQMMEEMMDLESPSIAQNLRIFWRNLTFKEVSSFSQLYSCEICLEFEKGRKCVT